MKTKLLFAILIALVCISCEPIIDDNNVDIPVSGEIVGTISCADTINQRVVQGYYIITDTQDSILTFNEEVRINLYYGVCGIYGIFNHKIPFTFTYEILKPTDDDYIHYINPVCNAMLPAMQYRPWHFKQAVVKPIK